MKLTIDFETRSRVNIKKSGAYRYAEDPSTEVMILAVKADEEPTRVWVPDYFWNKLESPTGLDRMNNGMLEHLIEKASTIEAHNAFFETVIWHFKMVPAGLPKIPMYRWRCSAAKAAAHSLPRSLQDAGAALGLMVQKDRWGHLLMMKLSKPNPKGEWEERPDELLGLFKYCVQDVEAEHALSAKLRDLVPEEQTLWHVDQQINLRGIAVDVEAAKRAVALIKVYDRRQLARFDSITEGEVQSPRQVVAFLDWLEKQGVKLKDLTKECVLGALRAENLPEGVREALEIRQSLALSSTAKFQAMVDGASPDGRMRETLMFHGASTGRWAGKRIQPHNMPRKMPDNYREIIEDVKTLDLETFEMYHGDPMKALSGSIRGFIKAAPGKLLYVADFASIEGRVLAWVAQEHYVLENYRKKLDAYCVFASQIFKRPYEEIVEGYASGSKEHEAMRFKGKTGELACGYQGGEKAVERFAPDMPVEERQEIVDIWRANRPETMKFWTRMERAAMSAVIKPRTWYKWGVIKWICFDDFLWCVLPSGRRLAYYQPEIRIVDTPWGDKKQAVTFMGVNSLTNKWERQKTYGGKLTENIVQAIARDILANSIMNLEKTTDFKVVLHVHDEVVSEVVNTVNQFHKFMEIVESAPAWAEGCPIKAEGFQTTRYRK